jgi:hypothetical protein
MRRILGINLVVAGLCIATIGGSAQAEGAPGQQVSAPGGRAVTVPGTDLTLTVVDVLDQRCPPDIECYWSGPIRVELDVARGATDPQRIVLCNLCDGATDIGHTGRFTFLFRDLMPSKGDVVALGRAPQLADYTVVLVVAPEP